MPSDTESERSENHLGESEQSMNHISNSSRPESGIGYKSDPYFQLLDAAANGNTAEIRRLIQLGVDVNAKYINSNTARYFASEKGQEERVNLLMHRLAAADPTNDDLATALHKAAENGHEEAVNPLVHYFAAVNARYDYWATALHKAAEEGHTETVELLLKSGASVHEKDENSATALHLAAENGHKEVVKLLLGSHAAVDARDDFSATALHKAAGRGHTEVVQLLLDSAASVDAKDECSNTALHLAVISRHDQVVELLLERGASADSKDENSDTPIQLAVQNRDKRIISQLVATGVNINEKYKNGKTLLAELSENGDVEMAAILLGHGADKEAIDLNGRTCIIIAVLAAEQSMVSFLIDKGAHIDASDSDLLTALHWSAKEGHFSILELLLQKNANAESKTKDGNTALHIAVQYNRTNIVATLIAYKADVNAKNQDGKSPIEVAISKGHVEIVRQLKDAGARMGDYEDENLWLLHMAAKAGQVFLIKLTLDKVNEKKKQYYMKTLLHEASRHGQIDVVKYLLEGGAEIELLNDVGVTPLFLAGQYPNVMSTLIHHGACINARNEKFPHRGILHNYASFDQIEGVLLLLNCGYNIHTTDHCEQTALHYVAQTGRGNCEIAEILLRRGVDVNAKDSDGHTALHYCRTHDSLDLAILLIHFGADIDAMSLRHRSTALHSAIEWENLKLVSLLVRHRANVNARNESGETALHLAASKNLTEECALLLGSGAMVNSKDKQGHTPLAVALSNHNPSLLKLLLEHGASVDAFSASDYMASITLKLLVRGEDYNLFRDYLDVINLIVEAGADCSGMEEAIAVMEQANPTMRKLLTESSYQHLRLKTNLTTNSSTVKEIGKGVHAANNYHSKEEIESEDESESGDEDEARIPLKQLTSKNTNVHEVDPLREKNLIITKHKYGTGFPHFKRLPLDDFLLVRNHKANIIAPVAATPLLPLKLFGAISIDEHVMNIAQSLLNSVGASFFASDHYFMLQLDPCDEVVPPKWASHFDKMKGIIRQTGLLIVQAPPKSSSWSIPAWYRGSNPYLRFIDAVYTCRRSCLPQDQEVFSDVLGGSEQKLAADLHATLIAGLSILSIAGSDGLVETLVMAILGIKLPPNQNLSPSNSVHKDWQIRNRRHCPCDTDSIHRPLSPIAAAKAVGIDIWRERSDDILKRVWDLQDDILVKNVDVGETVFITHRWDTSKISPEIDYQTVMENKNHAISLLSTKFRRIKTALTKKHIRYVWIDTICIDKANLSELDEAIRSMYKWYASCAAVVLDSGTPLDMWRSRGWCLQEGAAAGLLYGISKDGNLATIQQLAIEQEQRLCTLDLHLYYRPGNAVEILTRMDLRKTTRKEDMAYALAGIFSIDLTLAYGEGLRSRTRLLQQLAIQKGDLSFLSFHTTQQTLQNSLPAIGERHHMIAKCTKSSAPVTVSHFGICFEVQLIKAEVAKRFLEKLKVWSEFIFAKGRFSGVEELIKAAEQPEHQNSSSVEIAVVHDIRSLILVQVYGRDMQTGGGKAIKKCYRLQCCQIEEDEFDRLLTWNADKPKSSTISAEAKPEVCSKVFVTDEDDTKDNDKFERIWLGDKTDSAELHSFKSRTTGFHMRKRQRIL